MSWEINTFVRKFNQAMQFFIFLMIFYYLCA
jgi:hypothetical protein